MLLECFLKRSGFVIPLSRCDFISLFLSTVDRLQYHRLRMHACDLVIIQFLANTQERTWPLFLLNLTVALLDFREVLLVVVCNLWFAACRNDATKSGDTFLLNKRNITLARLADPFRFYLSCLIHIVFNKVLVGLWNCLISCSPKFLVQIYRLIHNWRDITLNLFKAW